MLKMQTWQWAVVAVVAVVAFGWEAASLWGLAARRSDATARLREATPAESGIYGAQAPQGARLFDAFSYRVGARFAGRVRVVADGYKLSVAGPRAPKGLYSFWIWLQGLLLVAVAPVAAWALVKLDWRLGLAAFGVLVTSVLVMAIGAGVWPGLGETEWVGTGKFHAVELPISATSDVRVGRGWQRGGLEAATFIYSAGIDKLAEKRGVSFYGPDETGHEVVYALHFNSDEDAAEFVRLLESGR